MNFLFQRNTKEQITGDGGRKFNYRFCFYNIIPFNLKLDTKLFDVDNDL